MSNHHKHITEAEFQTATLALFRAHGWVCAHFHDSRKQVRGSGGEYQLVGDRDAKGFPDTVATHPGLQEVIFMELKKEGRWPTEEQAMWLETLPKHNSFLLWPSDLDWMEIKAMGAAWSSSSKKCICWWCSGRREEYIEFLNKSHFSRRIAAIEQIRAVNRALSPNFGDEI